MEEQANRARNPSPIFRVGDKVWLNLKNIHTPQLKKKLAWVNAKYSITKIISSHVVELDVPSEIWPRFHVQLLRKANEDPLPSQSKDDEQPPPIIPEVLDESFQKQAPEHFVERILRAERVKRGKRSVRRVLVKWKNFIEPNWEDRSNMEETEALDKFEARFGLGDGVGEEEDSRQGPGVTNIKKKKSNIGKSNERKRG